MDSPLDPQNIDRVGMISARKAAKILDCAPDYVGKLCREGKLVGELRDGGWHVDPKSITAYVEARDAAKTKRSQELAEERRAQIREAQLATKGLFGRSLMRVSEHRGMALKSLAVGVVFFVVSAFAVQAMSGFGIAPTSQSAALARVESPFFGGSFNISFNDLASGVSKFFAGLFAPKVAQQPVAPIATNFDILSLPPHTTAAATTTAPATSRSSSIVTNTYPVIERTIERVVTNTISGITEDYLNQQLNAIRSQIAGISSGSSGVVLPYAPATRIDKLSGVAISGGSISNASISGGSISGVSISTGDLSGVVATTNGGTGTSSAPSYGKLLLGNALGGYDLVSTSSLGIGASANAGGADGQVQYNSSGALAGSGAFTFDSSSATLSITNLLATNATTTNISITNASTTNLTVSSLGASAGQCLTTNSSGTLTTTSCGSGGGSFAYPFTNNATTTAIAFNGGVTFAGATSSASLAVTGSTTISGVLNIGGAINANGGVVGALTGNASTATALQTGRTINGVTFDGTANITVNAASSTLLANTNTFSGANSFSSTTLNTNTLLANATTTSFAITNVSSSLLKTLSNGAVVAAQAGVDYQAAGNYATFSYLFPSNATTTLLAFNGGLTATDATTTNLSTTNASTTNLVISSTGGTGTRCLQVDVQGNVSANASACGTGSSSFGYPFLGNATTTQLAFNGGLTATGATTTALAVTGSTTISNIFNSTFANVLGSTTLLGNSLFSNATTTNLAITNVSSSLLKTLSNGAVVAAQAGVDYQAAGTYATFGYLFPSNATTTLLSFNGGLTSFASSTIGNGAQTGGLTISGGATTTGNAYFAGSTRVGGTFSINVASCTGSQALQTNASGDVSCGTLSTGGASSAGGWTTDNVGNITLSTSTDRVAVGATSTPYAKFAILSGAAGTTTLALVPASGQTANIIDIYNTSGALSSVLTASGNLGLGTTSPFAKLSVSGNAYITGNATTSNLAITNIGSTLLKTDANGNVIPAVVGTDYQAAGNYATFGYLFPSNATTTTLTFSGGLLAPTTTIGTLNATSSATLASTTLTGSTLLTNATSTSFAITGVGSGNLLKTTTGGAIVAAVAGTDYATPSQIGSAFPFTPVSYGNATSTTLGFLGGFLSVGSSTITGNLAVSGTTTVGALSVGSLSGLVGANNGTLYQIATSTNFVTSLTAGSGISLSGSTGAVTVTNAIGYPFLNNATTTTLTFSGGLLAPTTTIGVLNATSSATLASTTLLGSSLFANATTSNFAIINVSSALLKTTSSGSVVAAVAGTDYLTSANIFAYPFPNDATTTSIAFNGGLTATGATLASTTLTGNFVFANATGTNATTTSLFSTIARFTTASTTNFIISTAPNCSSSQALMTDASGNVSCGAVATGVSLSANNTWTGLQSFAAGASTTQLSVFNRAYFGAVGTTTIDSTGAITVTSNTTNTFPYASSTALSVSAALYTPVSSALLKTDSSGKLTAAIAGTDYNTYAWPFTPTTNFGAAAVSTSTPTWFTAGVQASSTSHFAFADFSGAITSTATTSNVFPFASTTALSVSGSLYGAGLSTCNTGADKLLWNGGTFTCGTDAGASGTTEINWAYFNNSGIRVATSSNQVLIGFTSTSTNSRLEVVGGATFDSATTTSLSASGIASFAGTVGIGSTTPTAKLTISGGNLLQVASGNPTIVTTVATTSATHSYESVVSGGYLYSADFDAGLRIIDITNPKTPVTVGSYNTGFTAVRTVAVSGKYAYIGDNSAGLGILDVSNPTSIKRVGTLAGIGAYQIKVSGKYAYITDEGGGKLDIVDIGDPTNPRLITAFTTAGGQPRPLAVQGKYAYVGDNGSSGVYIIDISNPVSPVTVGTYVGNSPRGLAVAGKYLYIADEGGGVQVVNVANPASPAFINDYNSGSQYFGITLAGDYAYLADHTGSITVADIHNPAAITTVGTLSVGGAPLNVTLVGKYAYVAADGNSQRVVDLNGAQLPLASIGSIAAQTVNITDTLGVGGDITAGGGLNVGISGIFSRGTIAAYVASSTQTNPTVASFIGGNVGIGTTTPFTKLSVSGNGHFEGSLTASTITATTSASLASTTLSGNTLLTDATTTSFAISGISSGNLLKTTTGGAIVAAVAGTDYITGAGLASAFPFTATTFGSTAANSTSTLIGFTNGVYALASSTIGDGTQIGGLTISGGATTTGSVNILSTSGLQINGITGIAGSTTKNNFDFAGATSSLVNLGTYNYAIGQYALGNATSSLLQSNFAVGQFALQGSTTQQNSGNNNTAIGQSALKSNTTGSNNVAFGINALTSNTSGGSNNAFGNGALSVNTTSSNNNAFGSSALGANVTGSNNNAFGANALLSNQTGSNNVAIGPSALRGVLSGSNNIGIGSNAGRTITTGYSNLMLGDNTQTTGGVTTGYGNIYLGANIFAADPAANNQLNIGNILFGTLPATTTAFSLPTSGSVGIGTSSPFSKFAIQTNNGDTATTLFAVGSSTASATTTLFTVDNTGLVSGLNLSLTGGATTSALSVTASTTVGGAFNSVSSNLLGSTTLLGSSLFSNATTTTFAITGVTGSLLKTLSSGAVVAAVAGTDYVTGSGLSSAYPFPNQVGGGNATSSLTGFTGGILATASSTIGNGNQTGGLTISGGATTTGNVYIGGRLGIGTSTPTTQLSLNGTGSTNGITFGGDASANLYRVGAGNIKTDGALDVTGQVNVLGNGLDLTGTLFARGNLTVLNKASSGWVTWATRNTTSSADTVYDLSNIGTLTVASSTSLASTTLTGSTLLTNATTTNFFATLASTTNLFANGATTTSFAITGISSGSLLKTTTGGAVIAAVAGTDYVTGAGLTAAFPWTPTNNFGVNTNATSTTLSLLNGLNASTTVRFGSAASTTFTWSSQLGALGIGTSSPYAMLSIFAASTTGSTVVPTTLFVISSSTAANATTTLFSISNTGLTTLLNLSATSATTSALAVTASSTIGGAFNSVSSNLLGSTTLLGNSLFSNATTTTFAISGISSDSILKTTTGGALIAAVAGTDYVTGAGLAAAYPFQVAGNATSTLTQFNGGLTAFGSTTIGGGATTTGLTINGAATTTGKSIFAPGGVGNPSITFDGAPNTGFYKGGTTFVNLAINGVASYQFGTFLACASNGCAQISSQSSSASAPSFMFGADSTTGLFRAAAGALGFTSVGIESARIDAARNLSIGTTSATARLTVAATSSASGLPLFDIQSPTTAGFATSSVFRVDAVGSTTLFQIPSSLLKTDSNGTIIAAVAGTDYLNSSSLASAYPFQLTGNATSTLTQFNGGLTAFASSTIGAGGQTTGLTISGGATTTGNAYFGGKLSIASTSPFAKLSVHANNGDTTGVLFAIGSSTASATTTLFSVSNTGSTTIANGINITAGCFAVSGTCLQSASFTYPFPNQVGGGNATSSLTGFTGGILATASSTIGNGTQTGGLTISGGATTTATSSLSGLLVTSGNVGVGTSSPTLAKLTVVGSGTGAVLIGDIGFGGNYSTLTLNGLGGSTNYNFLSSPTDANLYINRPSSNDIVFRAGNVTQAALVGANGYFGIGTTTPFARLAVHANNGDTTGVLFAIGSSTSNSTTTLFTVTNTGNVGIGTTSPIASLSVAGSAVFGSTGQNGIFLLPSSGSPFIGLKQNALLQIGRNFNGDISIDTSGNVGIGSSSPFGNFTVQKAYGNSSGTLFNIGSSTASDNSTGTSLFNISSTGSTTAANGINITAGCFAISGACLTAYTGVGQLGAGTTGQVAYFSGTNSAVGTSTLFISTGGSIGIGTTSPQIGGVNAARKFLTIQGTSDMGVLELASGAAVSDGLAVGQIQFSNTQDSSSNTDKRLAGIVGLVDGATAGDPGGALRFLTHQAGTGSATYLEKVRISGAGNLGVGTSSPFANLSVQKIYGNPNTTLFNIGSSTASDNSTGTSLFSVSSTGSTTAANGINITAGCFAISGTCLQSAAFSYPFSNQAGGGNATSSLVGFTGGILATASSTIGNGTRTGGLTISGGATTTATSTLAGLLVTSGNVGIGTLTPTYGLDVSGTAHVSGAVTFDSTLTVGGVSGGITLNSGGAGTASIAVAANGVVTLNSSDTSTGAFKYTVGGIEIARLANTNNGTFGLGTTSPYAKFSIFAGGDYGSYAASTLFAIGSTTAGTATTTLFSILSSGNVGIGTSSPGSRLALSQAASVAQFTLAFDNTNATYERTDSVGDQWIVASGGDTRYTAGNLWVCTGGSITSNACPTATPSGNGNIIAQTAIGIGTSSLQRPLAIENSNPQVLFYDTDSPMSSTRPAWWAGAAGATFVIGTTTNFSTYTNVVTIDQNGLVGVGTTSPSQQLSVAQKLFVANGNPSGMGTATSTFQGDVLITGKLDVSTIDPVYTIDGVKYATYGLSGVGVKEEVSDTVTLAKQRADGKYEYDINFSELEKGSDFWLFYQVTTFGDGWKDLVANLTPGFDGTVHYVKDPATNTLKIIGDAPGEVSVRLVSNRFDAENWSNLRPDQDGGFGGFQLQSK